MGILGVRILLLGQDEGWRVLLKSCLREVATFSEGCAALKVNDIGRLLYELEPDIVVTTWGFGGSFGSMVLEVVSKHYRQLPLVILSGNKPETLDGAGADLVLWKGDGMIAVGRLRAFVEEMKAKHGAGGNTSSIRAAEVEI